MAGDPPFHTTQTNAVEFPGPASLRFLKGAGLDAPPPPTTANHTPQIIAASEYQRCPSAGGAPGWRGRVGHPPSTPDRRAKTAIGPLSNADIRNRIVGQDVSLVYKVIDRHAFGDAAGLRGDVNERA